MFDEILKFGSLIVDALVAYKQPVQVYIPPHGELRGGAWVVVDPHINDSMMEMYADSRASGGVLEADGTISVKYRKPQLLQTMHRLDAKLAHLDASLQNIISTEGQHSSAAEAVTSQITAREKELLPIYTQLATRFAELHDTPGRMLAKDVIQGVVEWESAREFFYWRLHRRLEELKMHRDLEAANPSLTTEHIMLLMRNWFERHQAIEESPGGGGAVYENNRQFLAWIEDAAEDNKRRVSGQRKVYLVDQVVSVGLEDLSAIKNALNRLVDEVGGDKIRQVLLETIGGSGAMA